MSHYINTYSGRHFNYDDPRDFDIRDIAQGLSNICRFTGQLDRFYSVAQHSVLVSQNVPPHLALEALMHDGHEAYLGDVNSPLKSMLPDYQSLERRIEVALRIQWGLAPSMSRAVKRADLMLLATERRDFGFDDGTTWPVLDGIPELVDQIEPLAPAAAHALFMTRYHQLTLGARWYYAPTHVPVDHRPVRVIDWQGSETRASWCGEYEWVDRNDKPINIDFWCDE